MLCVNDLGFRVVISKWWWHCPFRPPHSLADVLLKHPCNVTDEHKPALFAVLLPPSPYGDTPFSPKTEVTVSGWIWAANDCGALLVPDRFAQRPFCWKDELQGKELHHR